MIDSRGSDFVATATAALRAQGSPCYVAESGGGLGLFASRPIVAGESVLVERPLALAVARTARTHRCAVCLADSRAAGVGIAWPLRCGGCGQQHYCSAACAAGAHPSGGLECAALAAVSCDEALSIETAELAALAVRILAAHGGYEPFERLVGLVPADVDERRAVRSAAQIALRALPEAARPPPAAVRELLQRLRVNLVGIKGAGGEDVAAAAFAGHLHLANHSCRPNLAVDSATPAAPATAAGEPPAYALVALAAVPQGEELCISYSDGGGGGGSSGGGHRDDAADGRRAAARIEARQHLRDHYGFECACATCRSEVGDGDDADDGPPCCGVCGTGVGVPVEGDEGRRRCVHCAAEWTLDPGDPLAAGK